MTRLARRITATLLALAVLLPPVAQVLESSMLSHMLVQMPLLALSGAIAVGPTRAAPFDCRWNLAGVTGLLAVALTLTFWMVPIAIDRAVASPLWDAAKGVDLVAAGAMARVSWRIAPSIVQAFFAGNVAWMSIVTGQLYEELGVRLCNAYLLGDQANTGIALSWAPIMMLMAWAARRLWVARRGLRPDPSLQRRDQV